MLQEHALPEYGVPPQCVDAIRSMLLRPPTEDVARLVRDTCMLMTGTRLAGGQGSGLNQGFNQG